MVGAKVLGFNEDPVVIGRGGGPCKMLN
jgi:hypothetical protein